MPAAVREAPAVGVGSTTVTRRPRWAQRQATARPITPPPTTTRSGFVIAPPAARTCRAARLGWRNDSLRRHYPDQVLRSAAPSCPLSPVHRAPVRRSPYPGTGAGGRVPDRD